LAHAYRVHAELYDADGCVIYEPLDTDSSGMPPLYAEHIIVTAERGVCTIYKREGMTGMAGALAGVSWVYRAVEDSAAMMEEIGHPYVDYSDYAKSVAGLLEGKEE